jgi:uncharacterized protein YbbC (DUF1343 family)/CubicO group peptidase (beta-lactamase class C family)
MKTIKQLFTGMIGFFLVACSTPRQSPPQAIVPQPQQVEKIEHSPIVYPTPAPKVTRRAPLPPVPEPSLDLRKLQRVDQAILEAIAKGKTPGGVLWVERKGQVYKKAFGNRSVFPNTEITTVDTIYDLASLTKVIATAPSIVKLHEQGKLSIHDPVAKYLPDFAANEKGNVTLLHLLTHTSGLRPSLPLSPAWVGNEHAIKLACAESLQTTPGTQFKYSDINFILLGQIVHEVSGLALHNFAQNELYQPLGMSETRFLPRSNKQVRIAPTTKSDSGVIRGIVHDPTSARMGGVAGHAGLFSTAEDLARFGRMLLREGKQGTRTILKPETVRMMTINQSPSAVTHQRGLGWDIASPYSSPRGNLFEIGSFGHTGWTGTSIWTDPFSETFVIFLANRNHPTEEGNVIALRRTISTLVAESIIGYDFPKKATKAKPPSPKKKALTNTLNGIDVLKRSQFKPLEGHAIGLITNHTGQSRENESTIDLLHQAQNVHLAALFSPEHGIRGKEDSKVSDGQDEKTGLHIFSLYGKTRKPTPEQLKGIEALVFDIQDIGCRFYTYISTMGLAMEAAAEAGIKFIVLDRINPISGSRVEGPVLDGDTSFIGFHTIPVRHGMTVGELAKLFAKEKGLTIDLEIVPVQNWSRESWLDDTSISWINPSPNMRSLTQAALYPGIGLLEMTALSVGRGTSTPFEVIGAPYIDANKLALEINQLDLAGLVVTPIHYTPTASVFAQTLCHGLRFNMTDRKTFRPIALGLNLARILHRDYPEEFDVSKVNRLLINSKSIEQIRQGNAHSELEATWAPGLQQFLTRRAPHLIYL